MPRSRNIRYISRGYDGESPNERTSDTLTSAIQSLFGQNGIKPETGPEAARSLLRWWAIQTGASLGLWGELPDGRWLSLDPEEAQDALASPDALKSYQASITAPPEKPQSLIYQVRVPGEDGADIIRDCLTIRAALTAVADITGHDIPIGPDFRWVFLRAGIDNSDIALCARLQGSVAAIPISLQQAENTLISNHAELEFIKMLRKNMVRSA